MLAQEQMCGARHKKLWIPLYKKLMRVKQAILQHGVRLMTGQRTLQVMTSESSTDTCSKDLMTCLHFQGKEPSKIWITFWTSIACKWKILLLEFKILFCLSALYTAFSFSYSLSHLLIASDMFNLNLCIRKFQLPLLGLSLILRALVTVAKLLFNSLFFFFFFLPIQTSVWRCRILFYLIIIRNKQ